ncbi:MAG: hypothetical protein V4633_12925 [Pseudomonadota bacterium]
MIARTIFRQAVFGNAGKYDKAATITLLLFAGVGALLGAWINEQRLLGACEGSGLMLATLAGLYWLRFATGAATQNSPANAALVPRLTSHARSAAIMAWLLTMALMLPFCFSSRLGVLSFVLLSIGVTGVGMYRAGREDGLVAAVLAMLLYVVAVNWPSLRPVLASAPLLAAGATASLAYGWFGLRAAFPRGGDAHWALLGKQRKASALDNLSNWDEVLTKDGRRNRVYSFLLKRYGRIGAGKSTMLMMGLGPGMHSFHYGYVVLTAVVLGLLVKPVAVRLSLPVDNLVNNLGVHLMGGVVGLVATTAIRFAITIRATAGEQALLMLTPGMPRKPVLNRALGRRLLGTALTEWAVVCLTAFALVAVWGGDRFAFQNTAMLMAACLVAAGFSLDDYARKADVSIAGAILLSAWIAIILFSSLILVEAQLTWWIMFSAMLGSAILYVRMRWQRMMQAPVAFPAVRLA